MKIKIFSGSNAKDVEQRVNEFLATLPDVSNYVREILFSTDQDGFSVLVFYHL